MKEIAAKKRIEQGFLSLSGSLDLSVLIESICTDET